VENLELWGKCHAYYDWNETNSESDEGNMYKEIRYFIVKTMISCMPFHQFIHEKHNF